MPMEIVAEAAQFGRTGGLDIGNPLVELVPASLATRTMNRCANRRLTANSLDDCCSWSVLRYQQFLFRPPLVLLCQDARSHALKAIHQVVDDVATIRHLHGRRSTEPYSAGVPSSARGRRTHRHRTGSTSRPSNSLAALRLGRYEEGGAIPATNAARLTSISVRASIVDVARESAVKRASHVQDWRV
jgi:hypothetical protein